ncbi:MAG: hypothetical protein JMJ93_05995 [Synergistaceae bacterium]|nr:hypothetical protein [Synergistaceae bacterium]
MGSLIELVDHGSKTEDAIFLANGDLPRDRHQLLASLGRQFVRANRGAMADFGVSCETDFSGRDVSLRFHAGSVVGALPLLSPTSGRPDLGLVIQPRFSWAGIGSVLGVTGWKVVPQLLGLPLLPKSERKVPLWVLSLTLLPRLEALLRRLDRKFASCEEDLRAPKGQVRWTEYAERRVGAFRFLDVPCRFPLLKDDGELKAAIHHVLLTHRGSLQSQMTGGPVVSQLLDYCESLIRQVRDHSPRRPSGLFFNRWSRIPLQSEVFRQGLQAMEWSVEQRGLAGLGELEGIPWRMAMEDFFESWLETLCSRVAPLLGGVLKRGRLGETVAAFSWEPAFSGTQRSLVPDLVIEREDRVIVVDAKYKRHWEELERKSWHALGEETKEAHRHDLLQVLAYSTLFSGKMIEVCLIYPCRIETWQSLRNRGRLSHEATVGQGERQIRLILTAVPMAGDVEEIVSHLRLLFSKEP